MRFIIMTLACYRLSHFMVYERGPLNFMEKIREKVGVVRYGDGSLASVPENGGIGDALSCIYCTSFWVSIGVVIVESISPKVNDMLAVSAGAIIVKEYINGKS